MGNQAELLSLLMEYLIFLGTVLLRLKFCSLLLDKTELV